MPMHADKVARIMFAAQIAVLVAGAGAVAMFLANPFQDPESIVETRAVVDTQRARPTPTPPTDARSRDAFEHTDWQVLLPSIGWAAPDPVRRAPDEEQQSDESLASQLAGVEPRRPEDVPPPESRPLVNWRYIGYLRQAESLVALLHIDNRQRLVGVGDVVNDLRVVAISSEAVTLNDGVREQRIQLAARPESLPGAATGARTNQMPTPMSLQGMIGEDPEVDLEQLRENIQRERERELERLRDRPFRTEEWTPS